MTDYRIAAAYIRVSTDDQTELSPDSQLVEIQKYAKKEGIVLLEDHIYIDPGISGKKAENRPEFMRMISAAKEKDCPFNTLLLWKFSRFSRNQEESMFYKSILRKKCGVEVISISEPIVSGPFGTLIERILEWMDEFYSIRLGQEVKRSMTENAKRGKAQTAPPFGYKMVDHVFVPDEVEAPIIQEIFSRYAAGDGSFFSLAKDLNARGFTTHRGGKMENRTIEYMLRNPVYIGKTRWNPTGRTRRDYDNPNVIIADGEHDPLVDMETWEKVQDRIAAQKAQWKYHGRPSGDRKHWLAGIVRCSDCGATLIFAKPHYFKCNNYVKGRCASSQHISIAVLEDAVMQQLRADMLETPMEYKIIQQSSASNLAAMETILKNAKSRLDRLTQAYINGVMDLDEYTRLRQPLASQVSEAESSIAEMTSDSGENNKRAMLADEISHTLETLVSNASTQDKYDAANAIIDSCVFNKAEGLLSITYRVTV